MYSGAMFTFYLLPSPPNKTKQDKTKQNKTNNTQPTKKPQKTNRRLQLHTIHYRHTLNSSKGM